MYDISKRLFDFIVSIIGLIILFPLFIVVAFAVKVSSKGPVFYRGIRAGQHGKSFRIYKFRSMLEGSDHGAGTTSRFDSRITRIGKFIRRHKIDEIPQLLNVFLGDMSFVGPRPELLSYTDKYQGEEITILTVKPGITDYSSIQFSNLNELIDDEDPDKAFETKILPEKNRLRIKYVKNRSFFVDIKLIIVTIMRVFGVK